MVRGSNPLAPTNLLDDALTFRRARRRPGYFFASVFFFAAGFAGAFAAGFGGV